VWKAQNLKKNSKIYVLALQQAVISGVAVHCLQACAGCFSVCVGRHHSRKSTVGTLGAHEDELIGETLCEVASRPHRTCHWLRLQPHVSIPVGAKTRVAWEQSKETEGNDDVS
jgi:hypothetical protein